MSEKQERRNRAFDLMVRDANAMAEQMGNKGRVTQREIHEHCVKIAEKADRKMDEGERNRHGIKTNRP